MLGGSQVLVPDGFSAYIYIYTHTVVIDRYWFFITDTDYLYVYVPDNRYLFTVIK